MWNQKNNNQLIPPKKNQTKTHINRMCVFVYSVMSTLCDPMDCSPPGSSVNGIFQARILEWVASSSSR